MCTNLTQLRSGPASARTGTTSPRWWRTTTEAFNTCQWHTPSVSPTPASAPPSGPSARADNALAESINGLYKTEVIRRQGPWRTVDAVEIATAEWVDWYNCRRLSEYAGDMPPAVLEAVHYAQQQPQAAG